MTLISLGTRSSISLTLASLLAYSILASASTPSRRAQAQAEYDRAMRLGETLRSKPEDARPKAKYEEIIRTLRDVYRTDPSYSNAPEALGTVAELYAEMGRVYGSSRYYRAAIMAYQFLMREYPEHRLSHEAELRIGEIYRTGLAKPEEAKKAFQKFLEQHPKPGMAAEAREKLDQIDGPRPLAQPRVEEGGHSERVARVVALNRWVGPNYSRIVIGVDDEVKFDTLRLTQPDRIVLDLANTHLSPSLVGKTFHLDDGFVSEVRIAQFKPDVTRIVLDVKKIENYSVFSLPNPFRLVIDIHGEKPLVLTSRSPTAAEPAQAPRALPKPATAVEEIDPETNMPADDSRVAQQRDHGSESVTSGPASGPATTNPTGGSDTAAQGPERTTVADDTKPSPPGREAEPLSSPASTVATRRPERTKKTLQVSPTVPRVNEVPSDLVATRRQPEPSAGATPLAPRPTQADSSRLSVDAARESASLTRKEAPPKASERQSLAGTVKPSPVPPSREGSAAKPATPTESGSRTLTRALGLKVAKIVIDPGHGGQDTGTIGPGGLCEKDLVLDVGLRLKKLIEEDLGSNVVMTRDDDTFVPLEGRTALANQTAADLFISIHANASRDRRARGVETYYLNFTSNAAALEVAARENATSQESVHQLQDLIKKIATTEKIEESHEFAREVQREVLGRLAKSGSQQLDRGVKKAPFVVLIGAHMPSILTEISFLTNPRDERLLKRPDYRQKVAMALYQGLTRYMNNLSSVRVAQKARLSEPLTAFPREASPASRPDF